MPPAPPHPTPRVGSIRLKWKVRRPRQWDTVRRDGGEATTLRDLRPRPVSGRGPRGEGQGAGRDQQVSLVLQSFVRCPASGGSGVSTRSAARLPECCLHGVCGRPARTRPRNQDPRFATRVRTADGTGLLKTAGAATRRGHVALTSDRLN